MAVLHDVRDSDTDARDEEVMCGDCGARFVLWLRPGCSGGVCFCPVCGEEFEEEDT